jgi:hypothetical protein
MKAWNAKVGYPSSLFILEQEISPRNVSSKGVPPKGVGVSLSV